MSSAPRSLRWLLPVVLLAVWLGVGGGLGPYAGKLGDVSTNDQSAFLPESAESTRVGEAQQKFQKTESIPAIVVWESAGDGGEQVTPGQRGAASQVLEKLGEASWATGQASPAVPSEDGRALQGVVQLDDSLGEQTAEALAEVRSAAEEVPGTEVYVAGPAATQADLGDAFAGIDGLLLGVALSVVLVILLLVYRSVLLPLVIITGSVFALALASAVVYALADRDVVRVDGQVQGILFILVIGAATDYALLLTARFREELVKPGSDRYRAMRAALRRSFGAISASAATVALGLLALLLSDLRNNQALGPVGAIGIVCAVLSVLTYLPAVLVLLGRAAYWPSTPQPAAEEPAPDAVGTGLWGRVAALVDRSPRRVWAFSLAGLVAAAAFSPLLNTQGVPLKEIFVNDAPSVTAQEKLAEHFPGGSGNPAVVIANADRTAEVTEVVGDTEGVDAAAPVSADGRPGGEPMVVDGQVRIDATLEAPADSDAANDTILRLRDAVHEISGADALVGGYTAQQYDTQTTAERDRSVITPVVLGIILLVLILLLRSLVMPVVLVATVGLNYLATLGVSALVFQHLLGFTATDPSVPLYGFVFLVALGVDYNIFLMTRVREETLKHGTRLGVLKGLAATGGVITSAGVVLAATFAALVVIPLAFLVQIAFIVAFGVLLDTLVVRSLLVPALVRDVGPVVWWPSALRHRRDAPLPAGGATRPDGDAAAPGADG